MKKTSLALILPILFPTLSHAGCNPCLCGVNGEIPPECPRWYRNEGDVIRTSNESLPSINYSGIQQVGNGDEDMSITRILCHALGRPVETISIELRSKTINFGGKSGIFDLIENDNQVIFRGAVQGNPSGCGFSEEVILPKKILTSEQDLTGYYNLNIFGIECGGEGQSEPIQCKSIGNCKPISLTQLFESGTL